LSPRRSPPSAGCGGLDRAVAASFLSRARSLDHHHTVGARSSLPPCGESEPDGHEADADDLENYNLVVGIGFMAVGFTFATRWE